MPGDKECCLKIKGIFLVAVGKIKLRPSLRNLPEQMPFPRGVKERPEMASALLILGYNFSLMFDKFSVEWLVPIKPNLVLTGSLLFKLSLPHT